MPTTRATLDDDDFEHLVRGGSLRLGDVEFCLQDIGFVNMERVIEDAWHAKSRLGRTKEVGRSYDG